MNKSDLVDAVASSAGITKASAEKAVSGVFSAISNELSNGGSFALVGFGSFSVSSRSARTGKNPKTGEAINIPAKKVVKFSAGKALKESVNK
jgi:DNA-binding protein HU-beta